MAGSHKFPLRPCKRAVVYQKIHGKRRFRNLYKRQGFRLFRRTDCIANHNIFNTAQCDNIAYTGLLDLNPLQSIENIQLCNPQLLACICIMHVQHNNLVIDVNRAVFNLADTDTPHIFTVINRRNQRLQRCIGVTLRCRDMLYNRFKQRFHIAFPCARFLWSIAAPCRSKHKRGIQLVIVRI